MDLYSQIKPSNTMSQDMNTSKYDSGLKIKETDAKLKDDFNKAIESPD